MARRVAACCGALLLSALVSCRSGSDRVELSGTLVFTDRNIVPYQIHEGSVISITLKNLGAKTVTIRQITPVSDPGLETTYVGVCRSSCVASGLWDERTRKIVMDGLEGTLPIVIPPERELWDPVGGYIHGREGGRPPLLIFWMRPTDDTIERRCLTIQAVLAKLSTGKTVRLEYATGNYVGAVTRVDSVPPDYEKCLDPAATRYP